MVKKKNEEVEETAVAGEDMAVEETVVEAAAEGADPVEEAPAGVAAAETAPAAEAKPKRAGKAPKAEKALEGKTAASKKTHKRAEKVGIVASDKMMKTVTVRVDRLVKHPIYRKYVKRRKKFMAHDETGAKIGDKVRIVETRPLSARKRWRVVEIIQKAQS